MAVAMPGAEDFVLTPIHPTPTYVTIREICEAMDQTQHWSSFGDGCPPLAPPPPAPPRGRQRAVGFDIYSITANPPMSASYGLMQITWYSVIDQMLWCGSSPTRGQMLCRGLLQRGCDEANNLRNNPSLLSTTTSILPEACQHHRRSE